MKTKIWAATFPLTATTISLTVAALALTVVSGPAWAKAEHHANQHCERLSFEPLAKGSGIVGLNYIIGRHGYPAVSDLYKGGPADTAGIKTGDEILAVEGEDTRFVGYLHLQPLLTGESGTSVTLKVKQSGGAEQTITLVRAAVESFKDPDLHKYEVAKWQGQSSSKPADHLIDLPFAMLSREHNRPTLFEFTEEAGDQSVSDLLKKHSDGTYILSQCRVVTITSKNPDSAALRKYLGLTGSYALIPVYQPWLVTVRESDILNAPPTESQLNIIATNLVHNSIQVQVSHAVAKHKGNPEAGEKLNKRSGLAHKTVLKRNYQALPANSGIVGLGFAADNVGTGYASVTQVFARGSAEKAGLKTGDLLLEVEGQDTRFLGLEHIQAALTGLTGKSVTLLVRASDTGKERKVVLSFDPLKTFVDSDLTELTVAKWHPVLSSNVDDSDEYELPCCMLAAAGDKPTIFEFSKDDNLPGVNAVLTKLKSEDAIADTRLQVVRFTSESKDYDALRKYFQLQGTYACLPIYDKRRHKTIKSGEMLTEVPTETELKNLIEKSAHTRQAEKKGAQ